jgi:hypothetical protein
LFYQAASTKWILPFSKHLPYAQIVGSVLYASIISRPNLAHPAGVLSRFLSKSNESHYKDLVTGFFKDDRILQGYVDADWGGESDIANSITVSVLSIFSFHSSYTSFSFMYFVHSYTLVQALDPSLAANPDD